MQARSLRKGLFPFWPGLARHEIRDAGLSRNSSCNPCPCRPRVRDIHRIGAGRTAKLGRFSGIAGTLARRAFRPQRERCGHDNGGHRRLDRVDQPVEPAPERATDPGLHRFLRPRSALRHSSRGVDEALMYRVGPATFGLARRFVRAQPSVIDHGRRFTPRAGRAYSLSRPCWPCRRHCPPAPDVANVCTASAP